MATEINELKNRWREKNQSEIPEWILKQPIELIRKAVHWSDKGIVAVMPQRRDVEKPVDESLQLWDKHGEFT